MAMERGELTNVMKVIRNIRHLSAEQLFGLLKAGLDDTLLPSLMLSWPLFTRLNNEIGIFFPEIIKGIVFTIVVSQRSVELTNYGRESGYDTRVMEAILQEFLKEKCLK